jgi:hypothetical protein
MLHDELVLPPRHELGKPTSMEGTTALERAGNGER